jgi:hypothetical protein
VNASVFVFITLSHYLESFVDIMVLCPFQDMPLVYSLSEKWKRKADFWDSVNTLRHSTNILGANFMIEARSMSMAIYNIGTRSPVSYLAPAIHLGIKTLI